jgi:hypothetical protein
MTILLAFCISLTRTGAPRSRMILAGAYGMATAVLALIHEAIPFEFALGAILAIIVLAKDATRSAQRIYAALAVGPGVVAVLLIAALGRRDISGQLRSQVPHGMAADPWAVSSTPKKAVDYLLSGGHNQSDYHDWMCENLTSAIDVDMVNPDHMVGHFGFFWLSESFIIGLLFRSVTIWLIRYFSGVPIGAFVSEIKDNLIMPGAGLGIAGGAFYGCGGLDPLVDPDQLRRVDRLHPVRDYQAGDRATANPATRSRFRACRPRAGVDTNPGALTTSAPTTRRPEPFAPPWAVGRFGRDRAIVPIGYRRIHGAPG